jgi:hypothetical protein
MCLGSTQSYPDIGPRDTSEEVIKSKYELSAENKAKNVQRIASAKSLVSFGDNGRDDSSPSYSPANTWDGSSSEGQPF